ncbi:hypothetical protein MKW98_030034, partial [Papaver atlanticum]
MSHSVKIYDTCIWCTQCVQACPTDVLEMIPWDGYYVGCKRCESACPTDFLSVRVYLWHKTTRRMGLAILSSTGFYGQSVSYLVFTTNFFPWLTIIVVLPIFAGFSIFFLPHRGNKVIRWYTISICLLELLLTTYDFKWINFFDFHWRLGIDEISIGPILLTGFITTLAVRPVTRDSQLFYFLMLAMYS